MAALPPIPAAAWVLAALLGAIALGVYGLVVGHLARRGGKIQPEGFDLPELLMTFVIGGFFLLNSVAAFLQQSSAKEKITIDKVLPGSLVYVLIAAGILCFLHFVRRIHANRILGIYQVGGLELLGWTAGLVLAAFPIVGGTNLLTQSIMKDSFVPQPLVTLFTQLARQDDQSAIKVIFFVGAVIAPCTEEFLFRGFFYRTWKRYLGPLGAGFIASALFAALHGSVPALVGLFVLACCLNIAYERTGSLLVPIGMHACFNFVNLGILYIQARFGALPVPL